MRIILIRLLLGVKIIYRIFQRTFLSLQYSRELILLFLRQIEKGIDPLRYF